MGPGAGAPNIAATLPSGFSSTIRPLIESATARVPPASAPTPIGWMNCPAARPEAPKEPSEVPPTSKTSIRLPPGSATNVRPVASTEIPRGNCSWPGPEPNAPQRARYL